MFIYNKEAVKSIIRSVNQTNNRVTYGWSLNQPPVQCEVLGGELTVQHWVILRTLLSNIQPKTNFTMVHFQWET